MTEFETEADVECPNCGHKFTTSVVVDIEPPERDEL